MSNAIIVPDAFGTPSKVFADAKFLENDELGAGITGGFAVVSIKGKAWHIRHRGSETTLMREDGDGAQGSIEVVIVRAAPFLSKTFYENGYVDGSSEAPDCYSNNGVTPDAGAPKKQANTCKTCPKDAFGSRVTEGGKQAKACSDAKKLAIVPYGDMKNEIYGGPMLLRVPAASLGDMRDFGQTMARRGFPSGSYSVRIGFDVKEAFPKLVFSAIKPLTDDEARLVMELRDSPEVQRIISEEPQVAAPPADNSDIFEQPTEPPAAKMEIFPPKTAAAKPVGRPKAETKAPPKVEPKVEEPAAGDQTSDATADDLDAELEALLAKG